MACFMYSVLRGFFADDRVDSNPPTLCLHDTLECSFSYTTEVLQSPDFTFVVRNLYGRSSVYPA